MRRISLSKGKSYILKYHFVQFLSVLFPIAISPPVVTWKEKQRFMENTILWEPLSYTELHFYLIFKIKPSLGKGEGRADGLLELQWEKQEPGWGKRGSFHLEDQGAEWKQVWHRMLSHKNSLPSQPQHHSLTAFK